MNHSMLSTHTSTLFHFHWSGMWERSKKEFVMPTRSEDLRHTLLLCRVYIVKLNIIMFLLITIIIIIIEGLGA